MSVGGGMGSNAFNHSVGRKYPDQEVRSKGKGLTMIGEAHLRVHVVGNIGNWVLVFN